CPESFPERIAGGCCAAARASGDRADGGERAGREQRGGLLGDPGAGVRGSAADGSSRRRVSAFSGGLPQTAGASGGRRWAGDGGGDGAGVAAGERSAAAGGGGAILDRPGGGWAVHRRRGVGRQGG